MRSAVSGALQDAQQIGHQIDLWIGGNPDARENERLVLSIHAVAFRPMITVSEDDTFDGLNHVFNINGDPLDQFRQPQQAFVALLKKHWNIGILEYWNIGILEYWNIGILEYWNIGIKLILHFMCFNFCTSNSGFIAE
jgi:hypothetical protein